MFPVELCPEVMRHFGLARGRRLMEIWFSRVPAVAPFYSSPVTDVIKFDWVLTFPRAAAVYEQLIKDQIWINVPAQIEIGRMLKRRGFFGTAPARFGNLWVPVQYLDDDYINERPVTGSQLDDLTAALAAFNFRVVVAGSVEPVHIIDGRTGNIVGLKHDVTLDEVGVYVRDSYDFEGDQFLGWWTYPDRYDYWEDDIVDTGRRSVSYPYGYVLGMPFRGGELLTNEDFKKFRKRRRKGGDFLVYSDIKRIGVWAKFSTGDLIDKYGERVFDLTIQDIIKDTVKMGGATLS
jgi:hypothetical protein